jgi:SAM-dependent methyltransferase
MAKKKKTKKLGKADVDKKPVNTIISSSLAPLEDSPKSSGSGLRLLRERIEAGVGAKRARAKLAGALTMLEAEYERVGYVTRSVSAFKRAARIDDDDKRSLNSAEGVYSPATTALRRAIPFVSTPPEIVNAMVEVARLTQDDIVYDLGSGDGRIVITATKQYGARGVGIDIDPQRIIEATDRAAEEGVSDRLSFRQLDLFEADIHDATVVMLYLLPAVNIELRQRLLEQLKPGTRIVSHEFDMGDWSPAQIREVNGRRVFLWMVPE